MKGRKKHTALAALGTALALLLGACNIRITDGNATSRVPDISADGRYIWPWRTGPAGS